jgi:hypothetical protein
VRAGSPRWPRNIARVLSSGFGIFFCVPERRIPPSATESRAEIARSVLTTTLPVQRCVRQVKDPRVYTNISPRLACLGFPRGEAIASAHFGDTRFLRLTATCIHRGLLCGSSRLLILSIKVNFSHSFHVLFASGVSCISRYR